MENVNAALSGACYFLLIPVNEPEGVHVVNGNGELGDVEPEEDF